MAHDTAMMGVKKKRKASGIEWVVVKAKTPHTQRKERDPSSTASVRVMVILAFVYTWASSSIYAAMSRVAVAVETLFVRPPVCPALVKPLPFFIRYVDSL